MAVDMLAMTLLSVAILVSMSTAQDSPRNVAVNKTASQSSTFDGTDSFATPHLTYRASADLAVDGAPTKSYLDKTCAVTDWINDPHCTENPWWQVDLGGQYDVFNVTIYQRGEREPGKENYGPLVVHIGDHVERPENRKTYTDRPVVSLPLFPPMTASTVNISITGCGILQLCEVEVFAVRHVEKCASNPCQHLGTCADGLLNYTCTCASGYTGVSCETDIDECGSSPCQRGATCENLVGRFKCDCPPGYNGTRCETDINECASSPCQHGDCSDGVNSYSCTCLPGYTGLNCSQDVDECANNPCLEGATCHNYLNFYNCTCAAGFTGQNCETNIDDCASVPCLHNASCKDGVNSYTCKCAAGYTGSNCSDACSGGYYGPGCNSTCSLHCLESSDRGGQHCDHTSGQCLLHTGCKYDFQGARCDTKQPQGPGETGNNTPIIGGVVAACVVLIIVIVILVVWCRRRQPQEESSPHFEKEMSNKQHEEHSEEEEEELEEVLATSGDAGDYYNTASTLAITRISPDKLLDLVAACRKNPDHLKEEYTRLPQGPLHPRDVAMNAHNKGKNRYKNICAYDHCRVVLSTLPGDPHSDYINACYVDGYNTPAAFIASQGPTTVNEKDFIRMIWEKDIKTIVMVTKPTEAGKVKCVQYWSDTEEKKFGKFKVRADHIRERKDIIIQRLTIKPSDGAAKQVTHFLYKAWPDKDVPDSPWSLIDFRDKVMTSHKGSLSVLVHCSAGIGRTGTLIALDTALRQLEEEGVLDVFNIVLQIRQQRVGLVQTHAQYTFLHEAALVGLCCAGRVNSIDIFTSDPVANDAAKIKAEFEALERCSTAFSAEDLSLATAEEALYDNRDPDILPPNSSIVWLKNEMEGYSSYLNAVFMPSYMEEKRYIVTQTPLPSTVVNFWRAVLEYDVKCIITIDQTTPDLEAGVGEYVPSGQTKLILGPLTLTSRQTLRKQSYTLHTLDVTVGKGKPRRVQQFVVSIWPGGACVPSDQRQMVSLARAVLDCTPPHQGVILLHCRDGARRSGLLCALLALLERCDSDREVAVPYVVGVLKSIRPQAVHTQEQYAFLYSAMLSHADSSQVYENVPGPKSKPREDDKTDSVYSN